MIDGDGDAMVLLYFSFVGRQELTNVLWLLTRGLVPCAMQHAVIVDVLWEKLRVRFRQGCASTAVGGAAAETGGDSGGGVRGGMGSVRASPPLSTVSGRSHRHPLRSLFCFSSSPSLSGIAYHANVCVYAHKWPAQKYTAVPITSFCSEE